MFIQKQGGSSIREGASIRINTVCIFSAFLSNRVYRFGRVTTNLNKGFPTFDLYKNLFYNLHKAVVEKYTNKSKHYFYIFCVKNKAPFLSF